MSKHTSSTRAARDTLFYKVWITRLTMAVYGRVFSKSTILKFRLKNGKTISTESRYDVSFFKIDRNWPFWLIFYFLKIKLIIFNFQNWFSEKVGQNILLTRDLGDQPDGLVVIDLFMRSWPRSLNKVGVDDRPFAP